MIPSAKLDCVHSVRSKQNIMVNVVIGYITPAILPAGRVHEVQGRPSGSVIQVGDIGFKRFLSLNVILLFQYLIYEL